MRFSKGKKAGLLALVSAFLLSATTPRDGAGEAPRAVAAAAPRPALWLLEDEDTRIYLFGTIHMLPPGLAWRSAAFDTVVRDADELVLEVADEPDADEMRALAPLMMLARPEPLLDRVTPDRRAALRAWLDELDMADEDLDGLQTWAAAMMIGVSSLVRAYAGPDASPEDVPGVEDALRADFARSRRPVFGVETGRQQLGFLSGLAPATQREMLEQMVDEYREGDPDLLAPNEDEWLRGDVEELAEDMDDLPAELFDVLITRRNTAWTAWLIDRLERPGTVLFAVGAGHLTGRDSVQRMLAGRGYRVLRLH